MFLSGEICLTDGRRITSQTTGLEQAWADHLSSTDQSEIDETDSALAGNRWSD